MKYYKNESLKEKINSLLNKFEKLMDPRGDDDEERLFEQFKLLLKEEDLDESFIIALEDFLNESNSGLNLSKLKNLISDKNHDNNPLNIVEKENFEIILELLNKLTIPNVDKKKLNDFLVQVFNKKEEGYIDFLIFLKTLLDTENGISIECLSSLITDILSKKDKASIKLRNFLKSLFPDDQIAGVNISLSKLKHLLIKFLCENKNSREELVLFLKELLFIKQFNLHQSGCSEDFIGKFTSI